MPDGGRKLKWKEIIISDIVEANPNSYTTAMIWDLVGDKFNEGDYQIFTDKITRRLKSKYLISHKIVSWKLMDMTKIP